jgi:hypothetical protein
MLNRVKENTQRGTKTKVRQLIDKKEDKDIFKEPVIHVKQEE